MKHMTHPRIELLAAIAAHLAKSEMPKSTFGVEAVGDPAFVTDLENGREPRWDTIARVYDYMTDGITHEAAKARAT